MVSFLQHDSSTAGSWDGLLKLYEMQQIADDAEAEVPSSRKWYITE